MYFYTQTTVNGSTTLSSRHHVLRKPGAEWLRCGNPDRKNNEEPETVYLEKDKEKNYKHCFQLFEEDNHKKNFICLLVSKGVK